MVTVAWTSSSRRSSSRCCAASTATKAGTDVRAQSSRHVLDDDPSNTVNAFDGVDEGRYADGVRELHIESNFDTSLAVLQALLVFHVRDAHTNSLQCVHKRGHVLRVLTEHDRHAAHQLVVVLVLESSQHGEPEKPQEG